MMDQTQKKWYFHHNKENLGPFTFNELQIRVQNGVVDQSTPFWCEGMAAWSLAAKIPELENLFNFATGPTFPKLPTIDASSAPSSTEERTFAASPNKKAVAAAQGPAQQPAEMSMLMELRPDEVDDRTEAIDRSKLRTATKEAARARNQNARAKIMLDASQHKGRYFVLVFFLVAILGGTFYVINQQKYTKLTGLDFHSLLSQFFSPLPTLDDVTPGDYELLKKAVAEPFAKSGPQVAIVVADKAAVITDVLIHPTFYVATNLPDGTNLDFFLHANPSTLLVEKTVDIRFPMTTALAYAKSPPIHTIDGGPLPMGEYDLAVVEDELQPPASLKLFQSLPSVASAPKFVPAGKKNSLRKINLSRGPKNE